jgi:hypothetical protein
MRKCVIIAAFAALALAVVAVRTEQARCTARILATEAKWVEARRELWTLQVRSARLRAPQQVHDRSVFLDSGVVPPHEDETDGTERVAAKDSRTEQVHD